MSWWQALGGFFSAGGAGAYAVKLFRSRKFRAIAADVLDGRDSGDAIAELRTVLDEQRRGYDHLSGRVRRLESEVLRLETNLAEARRRETDLERQLRQERKLSAAKIAELGAALEDARSRIAVLEAELAAARATPDGQTLA